MQEVVKALSPTGLMVFVTSPSVAFGAFAFYRQEKAGDCRCEETMPFLDFIHNRNASQQQSVAQTSQSQAPENAKQMYARQAAEEKANEKPIDRLPADQRVQVEAIKAKLEKATQHITKDAGSVAPASSDGSREAMRQNMTGQDKTAPALSPTSAQAGKTAGEKSPANEPAKTQDKPTQRPQTMPRPRPSWER